MSISLCHKYAHIFFPCWPHLPARATQCRALEHKMAAAWHRVRDARAARPARFFITSVRMLQAKRAPAALRAKASARGSAPQGARPWAADGSACNHDWPACCSRTAREAEGSPAWHSSSQRGAQSALVAAASRRSCGSSAQPPTERSATMPARQNCRCTLLAARPQDAPCQRSVLRAGGGRLASHQSQRRNTAHAY